MHFDGSFRCAQRISDLLVGLAANQLREDFLLTRCKAGKKRAQCGNPSVLLSHLLVPDEGAPDRLQQFLFQYRFGKEVFRARLDRPHRYRNVAMTGYEDDGQPASELGELILQLRPAQAGHLHIQQNTAAILARQRLQELLGRLIERNSIAAGAQQLAKSRAERCIVIDDVNDRRQRCHAASIILDNGSVKQNTAPPPAPFSAHILPP